MAIREHLAEAQRHLDAALEEFNRFTGNGTAVVHVAPQPVRRIRVSNTGSMSLSRAVEEILKPAGRPMHVEELYKLAAEMGYVSGADNPTDSVDIQLYKIAKRLPIIKVAARTWAWKTEEVPQDARVNGSVEQET